MGRNADFPDTKLARSAARDAAPAQPSTSLAAGGSGGGALGLSTLGRGAEHSAAAAAAQWLGITRTSLRQPGSRLAAAGVPGRAAARIRRWSTS